MTERLAAGVFDGMPGNGGTGLRRPSRPSLVPLPPPAEPAPHAPSGEYDECGESDDLHAYTELLISLLVSWVYRARERQLARRGAGLPAIEMSWENAIVDQYAERLGGDGAEIALALLRRSRPGLPGDGPAGR